ncbi:hypothetical protein Taro_004200 [Colocasia esculenta]|uniref:Uncharacterized protein n=1 Tax=Colocasia esculenta TaxID=4460 RepID=A0A843TR04_COLES|nr:hypothetical protein [Colocasia esculenta]
MDGRVGRLRSESADSESGRPLATRLWGGNTDPPTGQSGLVYQADSGRLRPTQAEFLKFPASVYNMVHAPAVHTLPKSARKPLLLVGLLRIPFGACPLPKEPLDRIRTSRTGYIGTEQHQVDVMIYAPPSLGVKTRSGEEEKAQAQKEQSRVPVRSNSNSCESFAKPCDSEPGTSRLCSETMKMTGPKQQKRKIWRNHQDRAAVERNFSYAHHQPYQTLLY